MTDHDLFLPVGAPDRIEDFYRLGTLAEDIGYDRIWMPETWGRDAITVLSTIAERTETIGIGTSLTNVYSRSPALVAQTAATLQQTSDGRFRLGVGPSGPILVEGWHGIGYERPLRRTRETIEIVRAVLSGETVTYDGDIFSLAGFRLRCEPPEEPVPVDAGGMGQKSVELAGRFGDGWHALMLTPDGLQERLEAFRRGRELGDRNRADQRVTLSLTACACDDAERARRLARQHLAFYVGAMGTFYREALTAQGFGDTAATISQEWANGNYEAATAAIDDELLDGLAIAGSPTTCRERYEEVAAVDGIDAVAVGFPRGADRETVKRTTDVLAPPSN